MKLRGIEVKWIDVKNLLPKDGEKVIIVYDDGNCVKRVRGSVFDDSECYFRDGEFQIESPDYDADIPIEVTECRTPGDKIDYWIPYEVLTYEIPW